MTPQNGQQHLFERLESGWLALGRSPRLMRRVALPLIGVLVSALAISLMAWRLRWLAPRVKIEWVDVPAGGFLMGSNPQVDPDAHNNEMPQHKVYLDAFRISKYEITNAQYKQCVRATVCKEPRNPSYYQDPDYADHPVVYVDWWDARTFCEWVGGRLPTEAEWEYAARGPDGPIYPWGNDFDCTRGNFDDETEVDDLVVPGGKGCDGYGRTAPVQSFPDGVSWCGVHDMAGNAWEWTSSLYQDYPYQAGDGREDAASSRARVVRGGSWDYDQNNARSAYRFVYNPRWVTSHVGFRCGLSSMPSAP
jgi:formylglycine-generating enzyme required for sulfatase activity